MVACFLLYLVGEILYCYLVTAFVIFAYNSIHSRIQLHTKVKPYFHCFFQPFQLIWLFMSLHPSWPPGLKLPVSQDINLPPACDSHLPYQVGRRYKRRWPLPRNSPSRADRGGGAGRHTFHVCTRLQHQKQAVHFRMWKNMTRGANVNTNPGEFIRIVSQ